MSKYNFKYDESFFTNKKVINASDLDEHLSLFYNFLEEIDIEANILHDLITKNIDQEDPEEITEDSYVISNGDNTVSIKPEIEQGKTDITYDIRAIINDLPNGIFYIKDGKLHCFSDDGLIEIIIDENGFKVKPFEYDGLSENISYVIPQKVITVDSLSPEFKQALVNKIEDNAYESEPPVSKYVFQGDGKPLFDIKTIGLLDLGNDKLSILEQMPTNLSDEELFEYFDSLPSDFKFDKIKTNVRELTEKVISNYVKYGPATSSGEGIEFLCPINYDFNNNVNNIEYKNKIDLSKFTQRKKRSRLSLILLSKFVKNSGDAVYYPSIDIDSRGAEKIAVYESDNRWRSLTPALKKQLHYVYDVVANGSIDINFMLADGAIDIFHFDPKYLQHMQKALNSSKGKE